MCLHAIRRVMSMYLSICVYTANGQGGGKQDKHSRENPDIRISLLKKNQYLMNIQEKLTLG